MAAVDQFRTGASSATSDSNSFAPKPRHPRVVIAGGGVAGVEALLALRDAVGDLARIDVVAPSPDLVYRPLAVAEPFGLSQTRHFPLAGIAADNNARLHSDSIATIDTRRKSVALAGGGELHYDALIVAAGARQQPWLEGALNFSGPESIEEFCVLLDELERGTHERIVFAAPHSATWTLPMYELALLTASWIAERGLIGVGLSIVTPEEAPLAVFGRAASDAVRGLLSDRGVYLRVGATASRIDRGTLELTPHGALGADRVITLPRLAGPKIPGLPSDAEGFIPIDSNGRVAGLENVYAAGDGTAFPVKQGGIAAQQADAAASSIAVALGARDQAEPFKPVLRGLLLTGLAPSYLRADISGTAGDSSAAGAEPMWWPPAKIAARHLTPYLAERVAIERETLREVSSVPSEPRARAREKANKEIRDLSLMFADSDARYDDYDSALRWLEVVEWVDGVLPPDYLAKRRHWQAQRSI
jgi:sulfide:quinone oxidoreductase